MRLRLSLIALLAAGCACPAAAGTASTTILVSASVTEACSIAASPLAFGNYRGNRLDASAEIGANCTGGTSYAIAIDSGFGSGSSPAQRQLSGTGEAVRSPLIYAIYADTARSALWGSTIGVDTVAGIGNGTSQSIPVYGRIEANQSPGRGTFQDAVSITISF